VHFSRERPQLQKAQPQKASCSGRNHAKWRCTIGRLTGIIFEFHPDLLPENFDVLLFDEPASALDPMLVGDVLA
jgi:hypothetical protein